MKVRAATFAVLFIVAVSARCAGQNPQQVLDAARERGFSGVVLIARDGEVVLHEAVSKGHGIDTTTSYWIGSVTKTFTAAAILKLEEQHRLTLTDSISRFFSDVPADKAGITVRQLLTHTSGIGENYAADGIRDRTTAVRSILSKALTSAPGSTYQYTNDGYNLLAAIIEISSGKPYQQYMKEQLLEPSGLMHTTFWDDSTGTKPDWGFRGASGIKSTAADLFRWQQALVAGKVLTPTSLEQMFSAQVQKPKGGAYGLGWQVAKTARGTRLLAHTGAESKLHHYAALYYLPDDRVVVTMVSDADEDVAFATLREVLRTAVEPAAK